jgi:hypothetical protein
MMQPNAAMKRQDHRKGKGGYSVKKWYLFTLSVGILFFCFGCTANEDIEAGFHSDYPVASSVQEVIAEAEAIVLGTFTAYESSWNMARNPDNIAEEDPNLYVEGRLYTFEVYDYLLGQGKEEITINLDYRFEEFIQERYMEPVLGEKLVLFLKYNPDFDHYYGVAEPFRFTVDDQEQITYISNMEEVEELFDQATLTLTELKADISKLK